MLDALWHFRGGFLIVGDRSEEKIMQNIASNLARQGKPVRQLDDHSIEFYDPLWSKMFSMVADDPWRAVKRGIGALEIFDQGKVSISTSARGRIVSYDVRMLHAAVFCLFGSVLLGGFAGVADASISTAILIASVSFLWLYGMNFLMSFSRVPALFQRIVANSK